MAAAGKVPSPCLTAKVGVVVYASGRPRSPRGDGGDRLPATTAALGSRCVSLIQSMLSEFWNARSTLNGEFPVRSVHPNRPHLPRSRTACTASMRHRSYPAALDDQVDTNPAVCDPCGLVHRLDRCVPDLGGTEPPRSRQPSRVQIADDHRDQPSPRNCCRKTTGRPIPPRGRGPPALALESFIMSADMWC